jgi:hypothetical protein
VVWNPAAAGMRQSDVDDAVRSNDPAVVGLWRALNELAREEARHVTPPGIAPFTSSSASFFVS